MIVPPLREDIGPDEIARRAALYGPLADAVRDLVDATIRTTVDGTEITEVEHQVRDLTRRLRAQQIEGGYGIRYTADRIAMPWGNAVIGLRNPLAPPLKVASDDDGTYYSEFVLGAAYEGATGHVHGGVCAMVLDHIAGAAAAENERPNVTGTLTLRFLRPTPLGKLRAEGRIDRAEGWKSFVTATLSDAEGVTVEAEGIFIIPAWAREDRPTD